MVAVDLVVLPSPGLQVTALLTFSWRGPLSYRNQSIDMQSKSMDWFLYDNGLRRERVKGKDILTLTVFNVVYTDFRDLQK